ncbi:hypothetical protein B0H11DRAFT_2220352 [Mycena galericulata]|nr:hypothetical protein B0H11DRAFT_2220352 [Mycena galericulata]
MYKRSMRASGALPAPGADAKIPSLFSMLVVPLLLAPDDTTLLVPPRPASPVANSSQTCRAGGATENSATRMTNGASGSFQSPLSTLSSDSTTQTPALTLSCRPKLPLRPIVDACHRPAGTCPNFAPGAVLHQLFHVSDASGPFLSSFPHPTRGPSTLEGSRSEIGVGVRELKLKVEQKELEETVAIAEQRLERVLSSLRPIHLFDLSLRSSTTFGDDWRELALDGRRACLRAGLDGGWGGLDPA